MDDVLACYYVRLDKQNLEDCYTVRRVFIFSSRVVSRRIKHAVSSANSCDIIAKALWLSNSLDWYSCSLHWNLCFLWTLSYWKRYAWNWSLICTSLIFQPTCGVVFTTLRKLSCNHVLYSSTYPASNLFSAIFPFILRNLDHYWRTILAKVF